jgi:hypothetical protein
MKLVVEEEELGEVFVFVFVFDVAVVVEGVPEVGN